MSKGERATRRRRTWVAISVAVTTWVVATPGLVVAQVPDDCNEYGLAVQKPYFNAYGTQGTLYAYNHQRDGCAGATVQTMLIILTTDNKNWVETGYGVYKSGFTLYHKIFGEWGYNGASPGPMYYSDITVETTPSFKVRNYAPFNWKIYWDPNGGTNWSWVDTFDNLYGSKGYALGEVSKYGSSGTNDAFNHEWALKFYGSSGGLNDWPSIDCPGTQGWDSLGGYSWVEYQSGTEFRVTNVVGFC